MRVRAASGSAAEPDPRHEARDRDADARVVSRREPGLLVQRGGEILHDVELEVAPEGVPDAVAEHEGEIRVALARLEGRAGRAVAETGVERRPRGELDDGVQPAAAGDVQHGERLRD